MTTQREARSTDSRGGRGARQRILNTATDLFYREGINATGVERLASEASVSKRTLYQHFPSKAAVVEEYLRCIQQVVGDPIRPGPDAANPTLLGNQLGLLYEGAAALSTSLDDPAPWTHARKAAATLIDQAVG